MPHPAYQIGECTRVRAIHGGLLYGNEVGTVVQVVQTTGYCYYTLIFAYKPLAVFREYELEQVLLGDR
jgi:hypothetical protein